jgi:hypothetical protein
LSLASPTRIVTGLLSICGEPVFVPFTVYVYAPALGNVRLTDRDVLGSVGESAGPPTGPDHTYPVVSWVHFAKSVTLLPFATFDFEALSVHSAPAAVSQLPMPAVYGAEAKPVTAVFPEESEIKGSEPLEVIAPVIVLEQISVIVRSAAAPMVG